MSITDQAVREAVRCNVPQARRLLRQAATLLQFGDDELESLSRDQFATEVVKTLDLLSATAQLLELGMFGESYGSPDDGAADDDGNRPDAGRFVELVERFPLRPIFSEHRLQAARRVRDDLVDREPLSSSEVVYVAALGELIGAHNEARGLSLAHSDPAPEA